MEQSQIDFRKQTDGKALNTVVQIILALQGKKAYVKGRPIPDFWKLRTFLKSQDRLRLNVLYDYICTLESSQDTLGQLFEKAEMYRQDQQVKPCTAKAYEDITIGDVLNL